MKATRSRVILFSIPVVLFALLNLNTQQYYVDRSRAYPSRASQTFVEIPDASPSHLLDEFATLKPLAHRPGTIFISDTFNIVYAKIENFYTKPAGLIFPSDDFLRADFILPTDSFLLKLLIPSLREAALDLSARRRRHFREPFFDFTRPNGPTHWNAFFADDQVPGLERNPRNAYVIADTAQQTVFNRRYNSGAPGNFQVVPLGRIRNHLIFIESQYGLAYYSGRSTTSLFQLEPDLFYDGKTMAGIGRRFLLNILNSSKKIRLELNFTETLKDDGECILHTPSLLGVSHRRLFASIIGRGSARVFFPAVTPRMLVGQPYIFMDMEVNGTLFPMRRTGLMRLYGMQYPLDSRRLVGFARDISALSEAEYDSMRRPSFLYDPPKDLLNPNLEYSGAYEDGWISEASQYYLAQPARAMTLVVRGVVPVIDDPNYRTIVRVFADNLQVGRLQLGIGTFDAQFQLHRRSSRPVRVRVLFDRFQHLPGDDGRPVAMKLYALGFQTPEQDAASLRSASLATREQAKWRNAMAQSRVEFGEGWYPLETYAGQTFRWANNNAHLSIVRNPKQTTVSVDVESGPGEGTRLPVLHLLDAAGHDLGSAVLQPGVRQTVIFPLGSSAQAGSYVLHIEGGGSTVPGDPRILDFRVFSISVR